MILLTCGRVRELWLCPTLEVHDSRTSRQIWQIWLAENMKWILCTCSENRVQPELSIPAAGQKDRGSGAKNVSRIGSILAFTSDVIKTKNHNHLINEFNLGYDRWLQLDALLVEGWYRREGGAFEIFPCPPTSPRFFYLTPVFSTSPTPLANTKMCTGMPLVHL